MNLNDGKYQKYALVREMLETSQVVHGLDVERIGRYADDLGQVALITGEGSSRIFPAKKALYDAHRLGYSQVVFTEGATQAMEYDLSNSTVFVASNSGKQRKACASSAP